MSNDLKVRIIEGYKTDLLWIKVLVIFLNNERGEDAARLPFVLREIVNDE